MSTILRPLVNEPVARRPAPVVALTLSRTWFARLPSAPSLATEITPLRRSITCPAPPKSFVAEPSTSVPLPDLMMPLGGFAPLVTLPVKIKPCTTFDAVPFCTLKFGVSASVVVPVNSSP